MEIRLYKSADNAKPLVRQSWEAVPELAAA